MEDSIPTLLAASRRFSMYIQIQAQSYFSVVSKKVYLSNIVNNEPEPP